MKHLISLSFKYIRRQKLRSVLTFLCIMLAVFILNTFTAYFSSIRATLINFEKEQNGSWEVMLNSLLEECPDKTQAFAIIRNHAAVEDYRYESRSEIMGTETRDADGRLCYFNVEFANGKSTRISSIFHLEASGTPEVRYSKEYLDMWDVRGDDLPENSAYFPHWVQELGYEIGDEITFTITPVTGALSEDSEQVKRVRAWVEEYNSSGDAFYEISDDPVIPIAPEGVDVHGSGTLMRTLYDFYTLGEIEFADEELGSAFTYTMTIAGFKEPDDYNDGKVGHHVSLSLESAPQNSFDMQALSEECTALFGFETSYLNYAECQVCINDRIEFEEGLMMLLTDLGFPENRYYDLFNLNNSGVFNETLLAYEMKSANALAAIMPLVALALIVALVAWFISRFVIDNAFEISVQERSAQFAVLRIMGASRAQLVALVFTEAIFYCITAVPIGVAAAFFSCKVVMESLNTIGFTVFTFETNWIVTAIGIFLSIAAILISAYTSAMWAARKLSPMEALQYGKPKKHAGIQKHHKSDLRRKSRSFVLGYTMKNILRTKSRYVISTIAMTLGVMMFVFSVLAATFVNRMLTDNGYTEQYDYELHSFDYELVDVQELREIFKDNAIFSVYSEITGGYVDSLDYEQNFAVVAGMSPNTLWNPGVLFVRYVDRETYETCIEPVSGIPYDTFVASGSAMVYVSSGGSDELTEVDEKGYIIRKIEDQYWSCEDFGHAQPPVVTYANGTQLPIMGSVCCDVNLLNASDGTLLLAGDSVIPQDSLSNIYTIVRLTVNGHDNYQAARELVYDYTNVSTGFYMINNYWKYSGLTVFINAIFRALAGFLISVWLVGVLTMVNSINTSVLNRQKELLMLRSVGMTKRQLGGTVILEGVLLSAVSTILGTVLGIAAYIIALELTAIGAFGITTVAVMTLPVILTVLGSILLNLVIAVLAAIPGLESLSRRMR